MKFSIRIIFCLFLVCCLQVSAQADLSGIPKKYHDVIEASKNGVCAFFDAEIIITQPSCNGANNGQLCIDPDSITGGVGPYEFLWFGDFTGDPTANCINNLSAGSFNCIITDLGQGSVLCNFQASVIEPFPIVILAWNEVPNSCYDLCDGQASPFAVGGAGGFSFQFDSGETTPAATNLCNPFNLTITDQDGCSVDTTFHFTDAAQEILVDSMIVNTCFGESSGSIEINVSGGNPIPGPGYLYSWTSSVPGFINTTSQNIQNLSAGSYTVVISDNSPCMISKTYVISESPEILVNPTFTTIECYGENDGGITLNTSGGVTPYSFVWTGPNVSTNTENQINLPAGNFNVIISDSIGCTLEEDYVVLAPDSIRIEGVVTDVSCFGDNDGSIVLTVSGGTLPYISYQWDAPGCYSGPTNQENINALCGGNYEVTVTDADNCSISEAFEVIEPIPISLDLTKVDVSCFGQNDGSIDLTITGGAQPPTTPAWSPMPFTVFGNGIQDLGPNTYTVDYTDSNGCHESASIEIIEDSEIVVIESINDASCGNETDGSISVTIAGGVEPYNSIVWQNDLNVTIGNSTLLDNIGAGDYTLIVEDANGCMYTNTYTVLAPNEIVITVDDIIHVQCFGDNSGEIDISVSGGTGTFNYSWTGTNSNPSPSNNQDVTDLFEGTYTVVVTSSSCVASESILIEPAEEILLMFDVQPISCPGLDDGEVDLTIVGGALPLQSIVWTGPPCFAGAITEDITALCSGTYTVIVVDANGCESTDTITIDPSISVDIQGVVVDNDCYDGSSGAIDITVSGAVGLPTFTWTGPNTNESTEDISGLETGIYTVVVDVDGCLSSEDFNVDQNDSLYIDSTVLQLDCNGGTLGAIDITPNGGTNPYTFSWSGPSIGPADIPNEDQSDLLAGTYIVTITDALDCILQEQFVLEPTTNVFVNGFVSDLSCYEANDGAISTNPSGGQSPYSFSWTGPNLFDDDINQNLNDLMPGDYNLSLSDANGCLVDTVMTVNEPDELVFELNTIDSNCDLDDGQATVSNITGGTINSSYSINWFDENNPIGVGSAITDLSPGSYSVEVSDDNDCILIEQFTISDNTGDITSITTPISCFNEDDGGITVTISGFTRPIDYVWNDLNGIIGLDSVITNQPAGSYTITATDALDCQVIEIFNLENPPIIFIDPIIDHETCPNADDGIINLIVSGGTGDYTYAWSGVGILFPQNQDQINLPPGTYDVVVTDENDCSVNQSFTINPASEFTIEETISNNNCFGQNDASIAIDIDFGLFPPIGNLIYNWVGSGVIANVEDQTNLNVGDYSLTVETPNGCMVQESYVITPATEINLDITTDNSICLMSNGSATVNATGGNVATDFIYVWQESNGNVLPDTDNTLNNASSGVYNVSVTDDNGCSIDQEFVISDEGGVLDYVVDSVSCPGLSDGAIDITYSGMSEPVTIIWTGPPGNYNPTDTDISGLQEGEYTVLITGNDGCQVGDVISVLENEFISSTASITNVSCFQLNDGTIDITVNGGTGPYSYTWVGPNGPITSDAFGDLTDLEPGDYSVTIVDSQMCSGNTTYTVTEPDLLEIMTSVNDVNCFGENDGSIVIVNINGGTPNFTFTWTKDEDPTFLSNFQNIDQLTAGNYNLVLSDQNGCIYTESFEIQESEAILLAVTTITANCGQPTGGASVTATGGAGNYSYEWFDGAFLLAEDSDVISNLPQGSYTVTVTDEDGCSQSLNFSVQNDDYSVTAEIINTDCKSTSNGSIDITLSDDFIFPTSELTWSGPDPLAPPPSSLNISNLSAGIYTLTLADSSGCPFVESYEVLEPDSISINTIVSDISCFGDESGSIVLSPTGGTPFESISPEYNFNWSVPVGATNPGNIHFGEDLPIGIYSIIINDSLGCSNQIEIELTQPTALELVATIQLPVCESDPDGSIEIVVSGGVQDYTYLWSNNNTTSSIQNLNIGDYSILVEDDNECILDSTFTIDANIVLNLEYDLENISCFNASDGSIDLTATGGSENFTINWNSEMDPLVIDNPNEDLTNLLGGEYYLSITDNINGCVKLDTVQITNPDSLFASVEFANIQCFGFNDGEINIETNGGTIPYEYMWTSGDPNFLENTESVDSLFAGNYTLEILDSNDCSINYNFEVVEPDQIQIILDSVENAFCNTSEDGNINTTITGGVPGYTVTWLNDQASVYSGENISDIPAGDYFITVSDTNACIVQDTITVAFDQNVLAVIQDQDPACDQLPVNLDGSESTGASLYEWFDVDGQLISTNETAPVTLSYDNNQFVLRVSNGVCESRDTLDLIVHAVPLVDAGEDQDAFPDEEVEIGGNPSAPTAVNFSWSPGELLSDSTLSNPSYLTIGTQQFILTITDENNCENRDSVTVNLINQVEIPDGFSPNGDGINDTWTINNSDKFPNMVVKIYSRWGDKLFESNGYETPWNGMYDNKELPVGTYYYTIDLRDPFFPKHLTGPLTIFR